MKSIKPYIGVVLIFLFGALSGSVTTYLISESHFVAAPGGHRQSKEARLLKRLSDRLNLDKRQEGQIGVIIHETHVKIDQIRQKTRPEIEVVLSESQKRIAVLLNPDQQETFRKIIEEHKTHRHMKH